MNISISPNVKKDTTCYYFETLLTIILKQGHFFRYLNTPPQRKSSAIKMDKSTSVGSDLECQKNASFSANHLGRVTQKVWEPLLYDLHLDPESSH